MFPFHEVRNKFDSLMVNVEHIAIISGNNSAEPLLVGHLLVATKVTHFGYPITPFFFLC